MLDSGIPTFAHAMGAGGYYPTLVGRMHSVGPDQFHGYAQRLVGDHGPNQLGGVSVDHGALSGTTGPERTSLRLSGHGHSAYQVHDEDVTAATIDYLNRLGAKKRSGQAAEPFRIYSPSSKKNTLWIVKATPKEDGLELKVAKKVKFEFSGRVITAHPIKPLLYVTATGGKPGQVPGAVVLLNKDGSYLKHQNVNFNDGACYMSLDKENRHLLGVSY
mgnify:CR=1 FL=1